MKTLKYLIFTLLLAAVLAACQMPASKPKTPFPLPSATQGPVTPTFAPYTISPVPDTATSVPDTATPEPPTATMEVLITEETQVTQPTVTPTLVPATEPVVESTPDPNQDLGDLRFQEQFDGSSGWLWGYVEEGVVSFTSDNGSVLAKLEASGKGWRISLGPDTFTAGDQQVQLTARSEVCGAQDEWGLMFRGALNANDKFDGYVVKLNCTGQVSVDRLTNNKSTSLMGWTNVATAQPGAGTQNTLLVWAKGSEQRIYVNGSYVATIQDSTYTSGEYGLYVYDRTNGNAQFRFTDLQVFDIIN